MREKITEKFAKGFIARSYLSFEDGFYCVDYERLKIQLDILKTPKDVISRQRFLSKEKALKAARVFVQKGRAKK